MNDITSYRMAGRDENARTSCFVKMQVVKEYSFNGFRPFDCKSTIWVRADDILSVEESENGRRVWVRIVTWDDEGKKVSVVFEVGDEPDDIFAQIASMVV